MHTTEIVLINWKDEVQETKQRLLILESNFQSKNDEKELVIADEKELVVTDDGWKSVANWRKLSSGMSALSVKKLLGDPHKIDGGLKSRCEAGTLEFSFMDQYDLGQYIGILFDKYYNGS